MKEKMALDTSLDGEVFYEKIKNKLEHTFEEYQNKLNFYDKYDKDKKIRKFKNWLARPSFKGKNSLKKLK